MNIKNVKPGQRVLTIVWEGAVFKATRPTPFGTWREVRFNEPVQVAGKGGRQITFTDGEIMAAPTMADLIVED